MDQIPPLADFERWLVQLSVSGSVQELWRSSISDRKAKPFILELVAEVRQHLLEQLKANWDAVLDEQTRWLSDESPQTLQRLGGHFQFAYFGDVPALARKYQHVFEMFGTCSRHCPTGSPSFLELCLLIRAHKSQTSFSCSRITACLTTCRLTFSFLKTANYPTECR